MAKGELLNKMLVLATNKHAGQFDRGGKPYILHPLAVMGLLESTDEELQCIALGHDVVEDCGVTWTELRELGFTERIISGIACLTKIPGQSYEEYKNIIKSNPDAIIVKIADLRHNTDVTRLKGVTPKDIARMEKYFHLYMELNSLLKQQQVKINYD